MNRRPWYLLPLTFLLLAPGLGAQTAPDSTAPPPLPYPRQLTPQPGTLTLDGAVTIAVDGNSADDRFAASLLVDELAQTDHVTAAIASDGSRANRAKILLARADSAAGRRLLRASGLEFPAAAMDEGYILLVSPHQAAVVAPSAAGIFYGVETLRQLIHPAAAGAAAAAVQIVDWPTLRWRAVQVDLSRGPISSLPAIERDLALLAELKINAYVMYFENTFRYATLPAFSAPGGAIDAAEAARIVAAAARYHITVIPEQEAFGHLHLGLQAERYQNLVEVPYGGLLSPAVPASLDFIAQMFAELAPAFPGPFLHIGADETAELGTGRSQEMLRGEGAGPLYLNYLKDIDQRLQPYHRKILFWGDIAVAHPELLHQLPKDMIAIPWDYSPRASYDREIQPFTAAGLETWVSPGVSNWSRIFPDYAEAIPNIEGFVRDGRRLGSTGLLNTTWNDDGESMFDFGWYGIAFGAAAGWEDVTSLDRFRQSYDWAIFRADGHAFNGEIQQLTAIHQALEAAIHSDGSDRLMWHPAFSPDGQELYNRMEPVAHQVRLLAEDVAADLAAHRAGARRNQELLDPVEFAAHRFDFVGEKAIYAHYIAQLYDDAQAHPEKRAAVRDMLSRVNSINGLLQDMRDGVSNLRGQYRALWLEENTPYFLDNILVRYDAELMYWQQESRRFDRISAAYASTGQLPPLVEPDDLSAAVPTPVVR